MTAEDLAKEVNLSVSYIKTHWQKAEKSLANRGIYVYKEGFGDNTVYYMVNSRYEYRYTWETAAARFGYSLKYFRQNFHYIQQQKKKDGIFILKIGRGDAARFKIVFA